MEEELLEQLTPERLVEFDLAEAEFFQKMQFEDAARMFAAIEKVLVSARSHPSIWLGYSALTGREAVEMAERAAVADLAVRLRLSEGTVRMYGHTAATLQERLPLVWAWFREGEISTANARAAADIAADLPQEFWAEFDSQVLGPAKTLAPARFRTKASSLRDRIHNRDLAERHQAAVAQRRTVVEHGIDGMGWLGLHLSSEQIVLAVANIDAIAFERFTNPDETRTMAQLRADVAAELLAGADSASKARVAVALTVPVLSLLGHSDEPAILEGVGPIDLDTARKLTAEAPSFLRILTDPITGKMLAFDPNRYRPDAPMRTFLRHRDVTCGVPGCGQRAIYCDIDHIKAWQQGGKTTLDNLLHVCRKHHRMKHATLWQADPPDKPGGPTTWTSPTGYRRDSDPPPY